MEEMAITAGSPPTYYDFVGADLPMGTLDETVVRLNPETCMHAPQSPSDWTIDLRAGLRAPWGRQWLRVHNSTSSSTLESINPARLISFNVLIKPNKKYKFHICL